MKKKKTLRIKLSDTGKKQVISWVNSFVASNETLPTTQGNQNPPFTVTVCTKDNCTCYR